MEEIEKNRKECDPVFHMLYAPEGFIEQFIETGIAIIRKRYGRHVADDPTIERVFDLLTNNKYEGDDMPIKIAVVFCMIAREPYLATAVAQSYKPDGGLFEERGPQMFRKLMVSAHTYIKQTMRFPYNESNIVEIIRNFVTALQQTYTMGSLQ